MSSFKAIFSILAVGATAVITLAAGVTPTAAIAQELKGDAARASKDKVAMCIGCHGIPGYKASFPNVYPVPMIGGQSEKYLANALTAYKKGDRKHPSMKGIAWSLSDQDIADLAAYYAKGVSSTPTAK
jgi:cytochrome c553